MKENNVKKQLIHKLSESELESAFEICLQNVSPSSELFDDLVLTKGRYSDVERTYKKGEINYNEYSQQCNKIRSAAIEIINKIPDNDIQPLYDREYLNSIIKENKKQKEEIERLELVIKKSKYYDNETDTKILKQLEGYWLELIHEQIKSKRIFSDGEFTYNESTLEFEYNGVNYFCNGKQYYQWKSINLVTDFRRYNVYYIYTIVSDKKMYEEKYGFGLLNLKRDIKTKAWWIEKGYFLDAEDEKKPKHHKIYNFKEITELINEKSKLNFNWDNSRDHPEIIRCLCNLLDDNPKLFDNL